MDAIFPFPLSPEHRDFLCKQHRGYSWLVELEMTDKELYAEVVRLHHRYRSWLAPRDKAAAVPPPAAPPAPVLPPRKVYPPTHGYSAAARQQRKRLSQAAASTAADPLSAYGDFVPWD
jgi:hypothetical protein